MENFKEIVVEFIQDFIFGGVNDKKRAIEIFNIFKKAFLVLIIIILLLTCFYTVKETEQAVITTFGKFTKLESAGPHFKLPFPIQYVSKVQANKTHRIQVGYEGDSEGDTYDGETPVEAMMITEDFNIVNIDFFVEWQISDSVKFLYSSDKPLKILNMVAQASARSVIGTKKVDGVLTTEKELIQSEIRDKMASKLAAYDIGIVVKSVKIQDSVPPTDEVKQAFTAVETAKQGMEQKLNDALSHKNSEIPKAQTQADKTIREAEGFKESKINQAKGEVAGFNAMYEEYAKNREITKTRMYLEAIERILPGVDVYVDTGSETQKLLPLGSFGNIK